MGNKHSKTHDHQHQQAHQKVDNLKSLESKAAPWISFGKLQQLSAHETSDYYKKIWRDGLEPLQRQLMLNHAADVRSAAKRRRQGRFRSPAPALLKFVLAVSSMLFRCFVDSPLSAFTHPIRFWYTVICFALLFTLLFWLQVAVIIGHYLRIDRLITWTNNKFAHGQGLGNFGDADLFHDKEKIMKAASRILSSPLPDMDEPLQPSNELGKGEKTRKTPLKFNVDVAKMMILLCALVYGRDETFAKLAQEYSEGAVKYLLRSEEHLFFWARVWGFRFTSITDFASGNGAFAGLFYKLDVSAGQQPFMILVFRGTQPFSVSEWSWDATCFQESAGDYLAAGEAHKGFYDKIFPAATADMRVIPYTQIIDAIKRVAKQVPPDSKPQLFVSGHSLGAGMGSLFMARLLECPSDISSVVIRDAYFFGTPRSCSATLASRVEFNLRKHENQGRSIFRVCNISAARYLGGDIVCLVPPSFTDQRKDRARVKAGSILSYAHIGIEIKLTPHSLSPFWKSSDQEVKIQFEQSTPIDYGFQLEKERTTFKLPRNPFELAAVIQKKLLPSLDDHAPSSYFASLQAVEVSKRGKDAIHEKLTPGSDVEYRGEKGGLGGESEELTESAGYQTNINDSPDMAQRHRTLSS